MKVFESSDESPSRLVVAAFLVVALITAVAFAQAVTGHVASMHATGADATAVEYGVTDDDRLEVTLRVHNPTIRTFELTSTSVRARVDGELVTDGTRTLLDGHVPAGESREVTVRLDFRDGGADRFERADPAAIAIEGQLTVKIGEERVRARVVEEAGE